ncbi:E3 ubiquitin-protein ligase TRIM39-like [Protopterus annectens]|uniref:E3 ubiquitin-protein ligase TRIM39-like n=1 Tax=Protopterus annectens TaxID=7888 RepID=UPI001CF9F306|nr:E3 ubiquitin-protein ligase TRIM39-like [Protopterus annectens]
MALDPVNSDLPVLAKVIPLSMPQQSKENLTRQGGKANEKEKCTKAKNKEQIINLTKEYMDFLKKRIEVLFQHRPQYLNDEKERILTQLKEEVNIYQRIFDDRTEVLSAQQNNIKVAIIAIQNILQLHSVVFLKDTSSIIQRAKQVLQIKEETNCVVDLKKLKTTLHDNIMVKVQKLLKIGIPSLILDENSAHPRLILSDGNRSLRWGDIKLNRADNPERFDIEPAVLSTEGFAHGRHIWEVEVGDGTRWAIGVANENLRRKGGFDLIPEDGCWTMRRWESDYCAGKQYLHLKDSPKKIFIYLDYNAGDITIENAEDGTTLCTFKHSFTEKIFPFFWSLDSNSEMKITSL